MSDLLSWFPFYVTRFLNSRRARRMSAEQVGIYLLLLCEQWENGPIPDDDSELAFIGRVESGCVRDVLAVAFDRTDAGWVNAKLEKVRAEQIEKQAKRAAAGRAGAQAAWQTHGKRMANAYGRHGIREEESRVDKKRVEEVDKAPRARSLPNSWEPKPAHATLATELGVDMGVEVPLFRDHYLANGKAFKDWDATFRNWLRKAKQIQMSRTVSKPVWQQAKEEEQRQHLRDLAQRHSGLKPVITERSVPTNSSAVSRGNISISLPDGPNGGAAA